MNLKRAVMWAVIACAVVALALPLIGGKVRAYGTASAPKALPTTNSLSSAGRSIATPATATASQDAARASDQSGKISPETLKALGVRRLPKGKSSKDVVPLALKQIGGGNISTQARTALPPKTGPGGSAPVNPPAQQKVGGTGRALIGQPLVLNEVSALSAAVITTIGGRDNQFSEVGLIADWDGREDCTADRGAKIDDFSDIEPDIDFSLTRAAISEHTFANGHTFNSYYYGDSVGNLFFGFDIVGNSLVDTVFQVNIPQLVSTGTSNGFILANPTAGDCTDDQVTVTGIAVNPVADLGDFDPALCGVTGEVIYVSTWDTEGCASNAANQPIRTRIFAFAIFEIGGTEFIVANVRQVLRSKFSNIAGLAVDDDGSLYYQLVDLIQNTGGAIFKATEVPRAVGNCGVGDRVNRVINLIPDPPTLNSWTGTATSPVIIANGVRNTNYGGGAASVFGNTVSLASGGCNVLYAAVARSFNAADDPGTQLTEGAFTNPSALGATPSMIISFADCSGAFDICSAPTAGALGTLPVADGFADVATAGLTRVAGVNNFRVFALGNGPDIRPPAGGTSVVPGTPASVLKVDMQIDFTLHSGLMVNEEGTVFVISGGTPAGIGKNPSPMLSEILCFEDGCPMDRRGDFVDLRGDAVPNPPASGGNVGDGDSDRFDHIFYQAPLDQVTITPAGLSGLARGFLRYTNRLAPNPLGAGVTLGVTKAVQGDDDTDGTIIFENLDPGHQVAGGDDQNTPFRGDDDNGQGTPTVPGPLSGGFEFVFGGPVGVAGCVWNGFFLNSNGNITFGLGDTDNTPTVPELRTGPARIAPAWNDLNPNSRATVLTTFPVQALGFANVNAFRVRWINVPEFGSEACTGLGGGFTNTFGVTLYDDGTGLDENANQPLNPANPIGNNAVPFDLQEGPTDLRFTREPVTGLIVGCPPRRDGSGHFVFDYCRMDLLGTAELPVITGYSIGALSPLNPPGLCEINLSEAARAADTAPFGVIQGQTASIQACLIGEGTEPTLFELFNEGRDSGIGSGGEISLATPDFDLRFEGNDAALCTSLRQRDLNRGKVGFFGIGCAPPANPVCLAVTPVGTVPVAPGQPAVGTAAAGTPGTGPNGTRAASPTAGIINAVCAVQLNIVGCGFFPNETTTICQGFQTDTGVPLQRPGKTVSTAVALTCDTNADGVADAVISLTSVTPTNINLVRATLSPIATTPLTAFPFACCGGLATLTTTTTFTAGDNNIFGPFTRTAVCTIDLGLRAPVVISVTPSFGNCGVAQDLLISGACFVINGAANVTSVFAVENGNPNNRINATAFVILSPNLIDAFFNFGTANAGKTFLIFVSGPNGTSQNLTTPPTGATCSPPTLGNQQGIQVTFRCESQQQPGPNPGPNPSLALITGCRLDRTDAGAFILTVSGRNIIANATVSIGGQPPRKVKFKQQQADGTFNQLVIKGGFCGRLPGPIIVTNPQVGNVPGGPSNTFQCNEICATN